MKLAKLRIDNFKAAVNLNLELSHMTALVGVNGSGKTTILEALEHFFRGTAIPGESYRDPSQAVTISVTFADVPGAKKPVTITGTWSSPDAEPTTRTSTRGLKISAPSDIINSVHLIFELAEHESDSDGTDESGLDLVKLIRSTIGEEIAKADLVTLLAQSNDYYQNLGNSIIEFTERMNQKLSGDETGFTGYSPGSTMNFEIKSPDPEPGIEAKLIEHGLGVSHKLAGHGAKRAYHMAALETHAEMSTRNDKGSLVLMLVDEPELHQHPQRLPRILQTYKRLADQPTFQIIYSTHSPELVDLEAPGSIYRISRGQDGSIAANSGSDLDEEAVRWSTSRSLAEGIFSDGVILVEGPRDRAILDAAFSLVDLAGKSATRRFIENNIHVVQTTGVTHMPDFVRFFQDLGITVFAIWDADGQGLDSRHSKAILEALGGDTQPGANPEGRPRILGPNYLCFDSDACMYFKEHFGLEGTEDTDEQRRDIKGMISDTPNLAQLFDTPRFRGSEFASAIVPHIYNSFPRPGGAV